MANSSGWLLRKGQLRGASREFQMALMNEPNNPDYLANFAKSRQKMGDVAGAEQYFRQALTVAPDHQPSYHGLAEVMLTQGRGQEAQAMLSTWAGTQPYSPDAHVELAWLQHEMGNTQEQRSLCSSPANQSEPLRSAGSHGAVLRGDGTSRSGGRNVSELTPNRLESA